MIQVRSLPDGWFAEKVVPKVIHGHLPGVRSGGLDRKTVACDSPRAFGLTSSAVEGQGEASEHCCDHPSCVPFFKKESRSPAFSIADRSAYDLYGINQCPSNGMWPHGHSLSPKISGDSISSLFQYGSSVGQTACTICGASSHEFLAVQSGFSLCAQDDFCCSLGVGDHPVMIALDGQHFHEVGQAEPALVHQAWPCGLYDAETVKPSDDRQGNVMDCAGCGDRLLRKLAKLKDWNRLKNRTDNLDDRPKRGHSDDVIRLDAMFGDVSQVKRSARVDDCARCSNFTVKGYECDTDLANAASRRVSCTDMDGCEPKPVSRHWQDVIRQVFRQLTSPNFRAAICDENCPVTIAAANSLPAIRIKSSLTATMRQADQRDGMDARMCVPLGLWSLKGVSTVSDRAMIATYMPRLGERAGRVEACAVLIGARFGTDVAKGTVSKRMVGHLEWPQVEILTLEDAVWDRCVGDWFTHGMPEVAVAQNLMTAVADAERERGEVIASVMSVGIGPVSPENAIYELDEARYFLSHLGIAVDRIGGEHSNG